MNTTESNKKIAEFMGCNRVEYNLYEVEGKEKLQGYNYNPLYTDNEFEPDEMLYNHSWNWLMGVVEKIETTTIFDKSPELFVMYDNRDEFKGWYWSIEVPKKFHKECSKEGNRELTKIEAVYNACVAFIDWYNEQNKIKQ